MLGVPLMVRPSLLVSLLLTLVMIALVLQQHVGVGVTGRMPLPVAEMEPDELAWRVSVPRDLRDDPVVTARSVVLEDGHPVGERAASNRDVRELGHGRYHLRGNSLRFATADQSHPQLNERVYELRHPLRVRGEVMAAGWGLMTAAWGLFLLARRRAPETAVEPQPAGDQPAPAAADSEAASEIESDTPPAPGRGRFQGWPSLAVAAACAVLATALWLADAPFSDGAFSAKGLPYSDAFAWNLMAEQIAAGDEVTAFPGQRRLFPWMLAGVYAWTGSWLSVAAAVQLTFIVGSSVLVYALVAPLAGSRWIGAAAALATVASPLTRHMAHLVLTEPCGLLFSLAALLLLWQGLVCRRLWMVAAAGVAYGLGNLACPFTFAAAPLYALVALAHDWRAWRGQGWWRQLRATVVLTIAVTAVYLPWMAFQQKITGSFSFSSNSAGLLYGAVTTDGGWGPVMFAEASAAGLDDYSPERDAFFMQRFVETVKEDPLAYARLMWDNGLGFIASIERLDPAPVGLAIAALLAMAAALAWRRRTLWPLLLWPAVAWLAHWSHSLPTITLVPASWLLLLVLGRGRNWLPLALLAATAVTVVAMNALTGNLMPRRGWLFFDWLQLGLWMAAHARLLLAGSALPGRFTRRHKPESPVPWPANGAPRITAAAAAVMLATLAWLVSSAAVLGLRQLNGPRSLPYSWHQNLADEVLAATGSPPGTVARLVILTDHQCRLRPNEEIGHYSRAFDRQEVATTVVRPRLPDPDRTSNRAPLVRFADDLGDLSMTSPFMLLTVQSHDATRRMGEKWLMEAVALVPLQVAADGTLQPDYDRIHRFEPLEPAAEPDQDDGDLTDPPSAGG